MAQMVNSPKNHASDPNLDLFDAVMDAMQLCITSVMVSDGNVAQRDLFSTTGITCDQLHCNECAGTFH